MSGTLIDLYGWTANKCVGTSKEQALRCPSISLPSLDYAPICMWAAAVQELMRTCQFTSRITAGLFPTAAFALSFYFLVPSEILCFPKNPGEAKTTNQRPSASWKELHKEAAAASTALIKTAVSIQVGACVSISQPLTNALRYLA